jgi:CheY-like chemotaxis protein
MIQIFLSSALFFAGQCDRGTRVSVIADRKCNSSRSALAAIAADSRATERHSACDDTSHSDMSSVLVVSDDADLRAVARRALERAGWRVATAAHSGHATLACVDGPPMDALVIENEMPEGRGRDIAARLRRYCPGMAVVVMCDGRSVIPADEIAVVRPFTADDLIDAIVHATARQILRGATSR